MYNDIEYTFVDVGSLPNVTYAEKKVANAPALPTLITHPTVNPIIRKLAKANPSWNFYGVTRNYPDAAGVSHVVKFEVYSGNEMLGAIWKDWGYNAGDRIAFDCRRLAAARQRGSCTVTKDVNKAFKLITKNFALKDVHETYKEKRDVLGARAGQKLNATRMTYDRTFTTLHPSMLRFMLNNWDAFRAAADKTDKVQEALASLHEHMAERDSATHIYQAFNNGTGYVVMPRGSEYVIRHGDSFDIVTSDRLTPHMSRCIGMLKLASDGQAIADIGLRGDAGAFFLVPDPQGEADSE